MSIASRVALFILPVLLSASDARKPTPGEPAPPLKLKRADAGDSPTWQSLRGTPVVLEFWATWCGQCVQVIPHWNDLASRVKGVRFVSVTDERAETVEKFLATHPIEGLRAFDTDGATHLAYGVSAYPVTALVDANGILRGLVDPSQLTEAVLQEIAAGKNIELARLPQSKDCVFVAGTPLREDKSDAPSGIDAGPGRWRARKLPLNAILAAAYSIPETNITVPDDLAALRFSMSARISPPGGDTLDLVRRRLEMSLKMHRENRNTKDGSIEVLVVDSLVSH